MVSILSHSEEETQMLGERMAAGLFPGAFVALRGGLGAGKTAFARGVGKGLNIDRVTSPTFTLVYSYDAGCEQKREGKPMGLHHFDVYRLCSAQELYDIGFEEYMNDGSVVLMEWPENVEEALPESRLDITISGTDTRKLCFAPTDERHRRLLIGLEGAYAHTGV